MTRVAIANPVVVAPDEGGWGLGLAIDSAKCVVDRYGTGVRVMSPSVSLHVPG